MGQETGRMLGATVGKVEAVDTDSRGVGWGEFLRVKIQVDLAKPLARGRKLKMHGQARWIPFPYERFPKFCFYCRIIFHDKA